MYKMDLALNNLQRLIYHKTEPNWTKSNQTPTTSETAAWLCNREQCVIYGNSGGRGEKLSQMIVKDYLKLVCNFVSRVTDNDLNFRIGKTLIVEWVMIFQITDLSFIESRIPLDDFLILILVWRAVATPIIRLLVVFNDPVSDFFFLFPGMNSFSFLYLVFVSTDAIRETEM